jgi:hypothetical protein
MVDEDTELKDSVQRLHRFVVDAVRARRGDPFAQPVTVAEIYQDLAPYRTVRAALGFEMNADYEHALVRMLSGIDGLTRLDPSQARERLKRELDSPNPDVTLYREYAACDVVLNPPAAQADWVREQLDDMDEPTESVTRTNAPDWSALAALSESEHFDAEDETQDAEEPDATDDSWTTAPHAPAHAVFELETDTESETNDDMEMSAVNDVETCVQCDSELPAQRSLRFCPFCGADQTQRPCGSCGEPLAPDWAFCIACGTAVASAG